MKTLILQPYASSFVAVPLPEWIPELANQAIVLCPEEAAQAYRDQNYAAEVHGFRDYDLNARVERIAWSIAQRETIRSVVTIGEFDLVRAGALRDRLGLPGQSAQSALAFRDKAIMKEHLCAAGIPVPAFRRIRTAYDILEFIEAQGFPVVLKPVDGAGSMGVCVVRNVDALDRILEQGLPRDHLVEQYVPGLMCHVDGVWKDGALWAVSASQYTSDCLAHHRGEVVASAQLDDASPLSCRLVELTRRVMKALPSPRVTVFHLEAFLRDNDPENLVFCEVASRVGGGRINTAFQLTYGVNLGRFSMREQALLDPQESQCQSGRRHAWLFIPKRRGVLRSAPQNCPLASVVQYQLMVQPGTSLDGAKSSADCAAAFVFTGASYQELQQSITTAAVWFESETRWDPPPP